jgi:protein involved in polysaccharide export with SLBB domain
MIMDRSRRVVMPTRRVGGRLRAWGLLLLAGGLGVGCASFSNPTLPDAIPVSRLPQEAFGLSRETKKTIPLTLLRQKQPEPQVGYQLDAGDVLGVFIEGVLGDRNTIPPIINLPTSLTGTPPPPAVGFPIPVQEDGTLNLPLIKPIDVRGKNVLEVQALITKSYTEEGVIAAGARILVSLARQRQYHVTVIRQDAGTGGTLNAGVITSAGGSTINSKRGTGYAVDLNAYENDVLNALARTGGLPGLDASSTIVIQRGTAANLGPNAKIAEVAAASEQIRIPLRMRANETLPFKPDDVVLKTGDIIFIESRDTEVYYTGGLLPVAELLLPRDYDLDVLGAVTESRGPLFNGGVNFNNLNGQIFANGLGQPSPGLLTIIRKTPKGGQITIRVDLNRAAQDVRERVLVQPGDFLILQESLGESLTRYLTQTFRANFFITAVRKSGLILTSNPVLP